MNIIQAPAAQGQRTNPLRIYDAWQSAFGGLNHTDACGDGQIYDAENICLRDYPVIKPRMRRMRYAVTHRRSWSGTGFGPEYKTPEPVDLIGGDCEMVVEKVSAVVNGSLVETGDYALHQRMRSTNENMVNQNFGNNLNLSTIKWHHVKSALATWEEQREWDKIDWTVCGKYLFINNGTVARTDVKGYYPSTEDASDDMENIKQGTVIAVPRGQTGENIGELQAREVWYDYYVWTESWEQLHRSCRPDKRTQLAANVSFGNGTYQETSASNNTMTCSTGFSHEFHVNDTVTIYGSAKKQNNGTHTIREISADRKQLRFYENEFEAASGETIRLELIPPDMDYVCSAMNRVFGCKGDTIYASALGDPYNWWRYDGLSSDSYSVDVGSAGDFTGCCEYEGDVFFFKQDCFYRLYMSGTNPAKWQLICYNYPGVMQGSSRSLTTAQGALFWLSRNGMVRYSGSWPTLIHEPIGQKAAVAVCGSDTLRVFACMNTAEGWVIYVYDTRKGLWTKHDKLKCTRFVYNRGYLIGCCGYGEEYASKEVLAFDAYERQLAVVAEAGYDGDNTATLELGDMQLQTKDHKLQMKLTVTAYVGTDSKLEVFYSYDGKTYQKAGELKPGAKRAETLSWPPTRNDFCRIKLVGTGLWKLYSLSTGKETTNEYG